MTTLQELFRESNAQPVLLDGKRVHINFRRIVTNGTIIEIEMLSKRFFGNPALCICIDKGKFQINERTDSQYQKGEIVVNFYRTTPKKFRVKVIARENVAPEIIFYNAWKFLGKIEEWFEHRGVLIDDNDPNFFLHFNNGRNGKLTFDDLVVRLTFFDPE